ncbi:hypothetical protein [Crenothrix sp.]|uniref:pilus assembly PilX family protein n=1 Tax=Crenothrix sp. TaxID=3100433 RepID=UPI00374D1E8D
MKHTTLKNQHGAVLAFSLVMLVLLTLASVSMIRQNKVQINIATNATQQVSAQASIDIALRQTQAILEALRYVDIDGDGFIGTDERNAHHCKSGTTNSIHPIPHTTGTLVGLPADVTATIQAEHCISNYIDTGNEARCLYSYIDNNTGNATPTSPDNWVRNVKEGSLCPYNINFLLDAEDSEGNPLCPPRPQPLPARPSLDEVNACQKLNAAGSLTSGTAWTETSRNIQACPIEVYTVHVRLRDANDAQRTVESKFEIDCSNDLNP